MLRTLRRLMLLATALSLAACGGGGSSMGGGSSSGSGSSGGSSSGGAVNNVAQMTVGPGPTQSSSFFNIPTTSVKVCLPASTTSCTTVSNVLVDTGSYGLRLLASALGNLIPSSAFQQDAAAPGNFIVECLPFADGFTWGPVASVDLYIAGEMAASLPINIIDDSSTPLEPTPPSSCSTPSNNNNISSVDQLGANGVLGVGLFTYDCGSYCDLPVAQQSQGYLYYSCSSSTCNPTMEPVADQVINPVVLFASDNNGVVLQLPAVGTNGATTVTGSLIFGIGTQSDNALGGATVLTTDTSGFIITQFNGQTLNSSFLDSGSNGLYFPDSAIPTCSSASSFFCPPSTLSLSATNQGANGAMSAVNFQIANLMSLGNTDFALSDVGGPATTITGIGTAYFDFGVPFFYGRSVYTAIDGAMAAGTMGPYFAY